MSMFKAGRAVGKGVKYLTSLGSKIGKSLGSSVDRLGASTRNTQASVIKGARGARDVANSAGSAARRGVKDARAGYDAGRSGAMNLRDLKPYNKPKSNFADGKGLGVTREAYNDFAKREPGIVKQANKMRGGPIGGNSMNTTKDGKAVWAKDNNMTKRGPKMSDYVSKKPIKFSYMKTNAPAGMSKNRRAGVIALGAAGAGIAVSKGNDALQNHYRNQKNAARGGR